MTAVFHGCHDGLEVAGSDEDPGNDFHAILDLQSSTFFANENGAEIAGKGTLDVAIDTCHFTDHYNQTNPTAANANLASIACRSVQKAHVRVRNCFIQDYRVGILWNATGPACCLDLGREAGDPTCMDGDVDEDSPGNNTFILDYADWSLAFGPAFMVSLLVDVSDTSGTSEVVYARGNTWLPGQQGADVTGCMSGHDIGPHFTPPPSWTEGSSSVLRNYSLKTTGAFVNFNTTCP